MTLQLPNTLSQIVLCLGLKRLAEREANKGGKSKDPSEKSKMHALNMGLSVRLLQKSLSEDYLPQPY